MMRHLPQTEIEQWAVLRTVVEAGGFAKAALRLNRSQSSVSYATARLQERLGVALLQVEGRRAILTDAGRMLLAEAIPLIEDLERIEQRGRLIAKGQEPRIRLLVDSICPKMPLFDALTAFQAAHPLVEIALAEMVRRGIDEVGDEPFDLAITVREAVAGIGYPLADVEMVAVARPDHPLQTRRGRLTSGILSRYPGLVIAGREPGVATLGVEQGLHWRVNTLEAAVETVRRGLCHGWLPHHMIAQDLASGGLAPLPLGRGGSRSIPIMLTYADEDMAGPLTRAMATHLLEKCGPGGE